MIGRKGEGDCVKLSYSIIIIFLRIRFGEHGCKLKTAPDRKSRHRDTEFRALLLTTRLSIFIKLRVLVSIRKIDHSLRILYLLLW
jgi:hypothetical protein